MSVSFDVQRAAPPVAGAAAPLPGADPRPFAEPRDTGLLCLICIWKCLRPL
ncbi:hypothetical protein [Actinacidiphila yanglinensis]|uniref:hypothetical protein n=1 Tax=Actinacidiphila yanglinensis TaxID=310779 RepID=UPI00135C837D|nr:hypothetical protein [Actinacidiphila yanglinensis]